MNIEEKVSLAKKNIIMIKQMMSDNNSSAGTLIKDISTDHSLNLWAGTQRRFIINGTLSDEEVDVYRRYNFDFGIRPLKWDEWFLLVEDYCKNNKVGKIPSSTFSKEGYALDVWLNRQIRNRRKLTADQFEKIESLQTYDSERALADAAGIPYSTYKSRLASGWSQEEALGLALRIPEDPELYEKTFAIDEMLPGVRIIFETNVFCVLGIPANSSKRQAFDSKDKLEKYNKIGAIEAYKTEFDFPFVQKPNREIGHVQVIFASFGILKDRWLWFKSGEYLHYWNRRIIERLEPETAEYDELLACYYQVLITDPSFSKKDKWDVVLNAIDVWRLMVDPDLYVYISDHLGEEDLRRYNKKMVVTSFREVIIKPLVDNIHYAEGEYLLAAIPYWRFSTVSFANYMLDECIQSALSLVNNEISPIMNEVNCVPDHSKPSSAETEKVQEVAEHFLDGKYKLVVALADALDGQEMYSDIIREKIRKNLWDAGFIVWKGGHDEASARIFSNIYMFCEKKYKQQIKNTFSLELLIDIPESEFSTDEKKKIADKHDKKKNYELAAKWYRLAADAGNADAQYKLGTYYEYGHGVMRNETTAYKWYIKAADNGNEESLRILAPEYYKGTVHCKKDTEKAKYYWILLFVKNPCADNEKDLDSYYPNWRKENNKAFYDLKYKRKTELERIADRNIAAAAYWLGEGLFGNNTLMTLRGILGYETDKDKARRWFLIAALCDFEPALVKLKNYYDINAKEASTGSAMFECANRYSDDSSEQGKDLKFYWLRKAVEFGYEGACNNLGVCYDDGIGTDRDYEKANELYLRAIKYNENAGAYYNYGLNLYYGYGVEKDEEKAKEYLLKAIEKGNDSAEAFLRENLNFAPLLLDFDQYEDQIIYRSNGLRIDFCGLKVIGDTIQFKFWVSNFTGRQHNIWLKDVTMNGIKITSFKKIGNYRTGENGFSIVKIDGNLGTDQSICTFSIEVDNENDEKLFDTESVQLTASIVNKTLECILMENAEEESLYPLLKQSIDEEDDDNEDDDEEDEDDEYYPFANEYFKAQVIYDQDGLRVEFGGFDVKDGEVYVHIWSNNTSNVIYKLWLKNIVVDGKQTEEYKNAGICSPGASWEGHLVKIEEIDLDVYYDLEFTVEINDQNNKVIALAKRVNVHIDFSNEEIRLSLSDDESEENGQDYSFANEDFQDMVVYDSNKFRVEFGGFEVQGEDVCIKIWSKNTSTEAYKLWLKDIVVDGDRIREYREIATSMPDNSWECNNVPIEELDLDTYYNVEFTVVISDLQDMIVGMAKRVSARIDFSEEEISAILSDHVDYEDDEEADADDGASASDSLFVENSFCMRNEERDGLEIYFPDIPNEYVRATMKEQGWRWHRQKGCWYVRENAERAELARRITGSEIKG